MTRTHRSFAGSAVLLGSLASVGVVVAHTPARPPRVAPAVSSVSPASPARATRPRLPVRYERNDGQVAAPARFVARTGAVEVALGDEGAWVSLSRRDVLTLRVANGRAVEPVASGELPTRTSYFVGPRSAWRTGVPSFARVTYPSVLRGVDLVFHGGAGGVPEYDLVVAPGALPESVMMEVGGALGLDVTPAGELAIHVASGTLVQPRPRMFQKVDGEDRAIEGAYRLVDATHVAFEVAPYDRSRSLLIDPTLQYATYLGGTGEDEGTGIAVDAAGSVYVTGTTSSTDFPTVDALPTSAQRGTSFVAKLSPGGDALVYATYLGGTGGDDASGIALGPGGEAFVTGMTRSLDFPTVNALYEALPGDGGCPSGRGFVSELSATGDSLVYSTYLGGHVRDEPRGIGVDAAGNAFVAGWTSSPDFPTVSPVSVWVAGDAGPTSPATHAFVTGIAAGGGSLLYSTLLAGTGDEGANGIAVDAAGNAFVVGGTSSADFPTKDALQGAFAAPTTTFVTELSAAGALVYSTFLGGSGQDVATGVAVDGAGSAYVVGQAASTDFPTVNPAFPSGGAFLTKLAPGGSALVYSTYLPAGSAVAVDAEGTAFVAGTVTTTDFPVLDPLAGSSSNVTGKSNGVLAAVTPAGSALVYATYLGDGLGSEGQPQEITAVAARGAGDAYVTGFTDWTNFPATNAICASAAAGGNAFVAWISTNGPAGGGGNQSPGACPTMQLSAGSRQDTVPGCEGVVPDDVVRPLCGCATVGRAGSQVGPWGLAALCALAGARRARRPQGSQRGARGHRDTSRKDTCATAP
jgi:hypothetical protein